MEKMPPCTWPLNLVVKKKKKITKGKIDVAERFIYVPRAYKENKLVYIQGRLNLISDPFQKYYRSI